jgi:hypothetical protein
MPDEIQIRHDGETYATRAFTFPGGELQVRVPGLPYHLTGDIAVLARVQSAENLMHLLLTTEIVQRSHRGAKQLVTDRRAAAQLERLIRAAHRKRSLRGRERAAVERQQAAQAKAAKCKRRA